MNEYGLPDLTPPWRGTILGGLRIHKIRKTQKALECPPMLPSSLSLLFAHLAGEAGRRLERRMSGGLKKH